MQNRTFDNRGSTLITVIVAIAFVTILVSIILGTTVVNVRMKGIDRRTKDDFYYAERSLNDIYTGLGQEIAVKAANQYDKVFKKVGTKEGAGGVVDFNLAETAEKQFRKEFMSDVYTWAAGLNSTSLEGYIQDNSKGHVIWNTASPAVPVVYQKKDGSSASSPEDAYRVVLKDVKVYFEDTSHFRSIISTDIVITTPTVDFLGSNADVSDYGLIANEGLYIEGTANITGNVYAGVHEDYRESSDKDFRERTDEYSKSPVYGGINIKGGKATFDGNYIISKGDVNLAGTKPQIKVYSTSVGADGNLSNFWYTSMRTISGATNDPLTDPVPSTWPTIDINANVFALNDLTLNADNTSAVIKGNYYGYNEGGLSNILGRKDKRDDAANSAIIVNGSKAYLDMKDINNFVLMGKAYIDFTSDTETNAAAMVSGSLEQVVPTAESVALKTNQQLYLVPTDFLDGANPIEVSGGSHTFNITVPVSDLENWFGYDYVDKSVWSDHTKAPESMHQDYKVALTGGSDVWYDYLVFDDNVNWKPVEVSSPGTDTADKKYITKKNPDGSFSFLEYSRSSEALGTGGSISSKAMFFLKIMMSDAAYEYAFSKRASDPDVNARSLTDPADFKEYKENLKIQPSECRLHERIDRSMGYTYFDLSQCVVGNSSSPTDAHYYAKNAVINYERNAADKIQSNVLNNTEGMLRYANYTQNLFHRYVFLCTKLDGKETKLLDATPETDATEWTKAEAEWSITSTAPLSHFVNTDYIDNMTISTSMSKANGELLKPGAFGVVIATNGPLTINNSLPTGAVTGNTFKGVAIVKGDIIVDTGINVDGLLMATGTITLKGNNNINYDKGLIQSRIEKEINIVKNKPETTTDSYKGIPGYMDYYLITYLSKDVGDVSQILYSVAPGSKIRQERIEADYNEFMHYENWQKGE